MNEQTRVLTSSKSLIWDTDPELIKDLSTVFKWDLDVCASRPNVCSMYFDEHDNGLSQDWFLYPARWMNPPYGKEVKKWVQKAVEERYNGYTVSLLFNRAGTNWFQDLVAPYVSLIVTIRGRLKFGTDEAWIERWIERYYGVDAVKLSECVGGHALYKYNPVVSEWVFDYLVEHPKKLDKWEVSSRVRKDAAPADSIFAVFGDADLLTWAQMDKLVSYGLITKYK